MSDRTGADHLSDKELDMLKARLRKRRQMVIKNVLVAMGAALLLGWMLS